MPSTFKTLILALLITFSFLAVSKVVNAGSADGKALYCECYEDKDCVSSTVFAIFFENGAKNMKYPDRGGNCGKTICLGDEESDGFDIGHDYEDGDREIRWSSFRFVMKYSLNRETLLLTETNHQSSWVGIDSFKRCEVLKPAQAQAKIEGYISEYNDKINAERKEQTKKNKI